MRCFLGRRKVHQRPLKEGLQPAREEQGGLHQMMRDHSAGRMADATRDHLLGSFLQHDCIDRVGSGSSIWDRDTRCARGHLPGLIDGPHAMGPIAHPTGLRWMMDSAPTRARETQLDKELNNNETQIE
eukprot:7150026-Pyramimonas_sp.AAC.1